MVLQDRDPARQERNINNTERRVTGISYLVYQLWQVKGFLRFDIHLLKWVFLTDLQVRDDAGARSTLRH